MHRRIIADTTRLRPRRLRTNWRTRHAADGAKYPHARMPLNILGYNTLTNIRQFTGKAGSLGDTMGTHGRNLRNAGGKVAV
jgi:hypothetical protein